MIHVTLVASHNFNVKRSIYVHGHFSSSSGGCGGERNPFSQNFCTHPPLFPKKFPVNRARQRTRGTRGDKLLSKVLALCLDGISIAILRRRNPKETGHQEESDKLPFVSKQSEIPMSQPCAGKS